MKPSLRPLYSHTDIRTRSDKSHYTNPIGRPIWFTDSQPIAKSDADNSCDTDSLKITQVAQEINGPFQIQQAIWRLLLTHGRVRVRIGMDIEIVDLHY